ncbi:MAG: type II toxin-antitoxin system RelE/ParE family toxin [Nitrospinae bacterium]|nr:type II toxin-antitoxin system RelE/ParE family toxin [Nitrospinota bacterium]
MSKWFNKWAKKSKTTKNSLLAAIEDMDSGNVVDLGSGLYKVRVSRQNQGRSSGFRTLLIYKKEHLAVFIYGFAKNERDNISAKELMILKKQAKQILKFNQDEIDHAIGCGEFIELEY